MSIHFKMQNGTVRSDGRSLCRTCECALIRRDEDGQELVRCSRLGALLTRRTVECSGYSQIESAPGVYRQAWGTLTCVKGHIHFWNPGRAPQPDKEGNWLCPDDEQEQTEAKVQ